MAKEAIHPKFYPDAPMVCACGTTYVIGATIPEVRTDICSNCHPFYTGEQRIVDTAGQVDRFLRRLQAGSQMRSSPAPEKAARKPLIQTVGDDEA